MRTSRTKLRRRRCAPWPASSASLEHLNDPRQGPRVEPCLDDPTDNRQDDLGPTWDRRGRLRRRPSEELHASRGGRDAARPAAGSWRSFHTHDARVPAGIPDSLDNAASVSLQRSLPASNARICSRRSLQAIVAFAAARSRRAYRHEHVLA